MALKRKVSPKREKRVTGVDEIEKLKYQIGLNEQKISGLEEENRGLKKDLLSLQIAPFKLGDYVMAEVSSGKTKKVQKCLLECENGTLYIRPIKENGELSGRHFSVIPVGDKTYSDFLKPVEE